MENSLDIDAYFDRIGYEGSRLPTQQTLNALILAHTQSVPFENLDVLLRRPIQLDVSSLMQKLVYARRGGYCFEQNALFMEVLRALGFEVQPISARVRLQRPRDFIPPRTHMFLRIKIEGRSWLADVGVGALSPTAALLLETETHQRTPHETRRLITWEGRLIHQALLGTEWADICEFTLEEMPPIDREVANWFTSAHPQSHFLNRLIAAKATPEGRKTLLNWEFSQRGLDGVAHSRTLKNQADLRSVLATEFGLHFPEGTEFQCAGLERPNTLAGT